MPTITDEIVDLEMRRLVGMRDRDVAAVAAVYHDDLVFVHSTGARQSKAELLAALKDAPSRGFRLGGVEVTGWGDWARLVGDLTFIFTPEDRPPVEVRMMVTRIAVKHDGVWRFVSMHASPVRE